MTTKPLRFFYGLARTAVHAAFVVSASLALVLLFLLWSIAYLFDQSQSGP